MSERILKALLRLFAILAKDEEGVVEEGKLGGRRIIESFLKQELNHELVQDYLKVFDDFVEAHHAAAKRKDGKKKRISLNSVKILKICSEINEELTQRQKVVVLFRTLEFIYADGVVTTQEDEFVEIVSDTFKILREEFTLIKNFVAFDETKVIDSPYIMYVNSKESPETENAKHFQSKGIEGEVRILQVNSVNNYFLKFLGKDELYLNGQSVRNQKNYIFTQGSAIRGPKVNPIYYSDIISRFLSDKTGQKIVFKVDEIGYTFKGGRTGLHEMSFAEDSGKLIGIMGASGAGKSTLLNVLNGNYRPTTGKVTINGIDIHRESSNIEGVIGYVSQDDLLIEELTVFQNLYYNAKLCFDKLNDAQLVKLVLKLLNTLGLFEIKDLKVGSSLDKTISGGQRKRLNIALELIREPSVLFVDEPTSGLSSRDSENIMDLLKELALKGKLIFVVIHQPSSDIFKMFDKLIILDQGGYPIYNGNPVNAIIYFKMRVNHANSNESQCPVCGNVNPEQIFNIIEAKVVDEYGNLTNNRKVSPKQWNEFYDEYVIPKMTPVLDVFETPKSTFKIPNPIKQLRVYFIRDVLSKLTNRQYVLVNLLEAPALAAILAFFVKYYNIASQPNKEYIFRESENIPQFLFISVVVALFLGLTVSAEEIIKDRKILKRESFLNLSKISYLNSKITIMFIISAVQMALFTIVGNTILEIKGMMFYNWAILFSVSCFANILGLNVSASFNSAKVIYILIPIMIIPQLLFSGVIVKFDKLNPLFSSEEGVPWIGNIMASRWAYEAMAVTQFTNNNYNQQFYQLDQMKKFSTWKKDYWISDMVSANNYLKRDDNKSEHLEIYNTKLALLKYEIKGEEDYLYGLIQCNCADSLTPELYSKRISDKVSSYLTEVKRHYRSVFSSAENLKDSILRIDYTATEEGKIAYQSLLNNHTNESLEDFVTNSNSFEKIVEKNNRLIQKADPIYRLPYDKSLFNAHFYAPVKRFFGDMISTFLANVIVLWGMTFTLLLTLYVDFFRKILEGIERIGSKK